MSQLSDIMTAQKNLEECFMKKMAEIETQIRCAGSAKDTVAKVAEEFRTFRELIFTLLGLLRKQINECTKQVDEMESRHRRKTLIFLGVPEADREDCRAIILDTINNKMGLKDFTSSSIKNCHRLGATSNQRPRPILVKFSCVDVKHTVWGAKKQLKGTSISTKEFLTKARQSVFTKARLHFGMRSCWTLDGVIVIRASDSSRHKVTSFDELNTVIGKYPKSVSGSSSSKDTVGSGSKL